MRVVLIGASGTIGSAVGKLLAERYEIVTVGRKSGDIHADITVPASLREMYERVGPCDAVVVAAGEARFGEMKDLDEEDYLFCLTHKLLGQVNVVRLGLDAVRRGGSFTLTSGVLASEPTRGSTGISLVNAALEGFARAAMLELEGRRINVVSPPWVSETLQALGRNAARGLPAATVARAYRESVEGKRNGEVIDARQFA
jgi:NAD(P)-dependent dehydrogenase (short-subunit alcohol dehydrogenase family)